MEALANTQPVDLAPIRAAMPIIKVVGLGGGGCNAVNRMIEYGMKGVEFVACNTDKQALETSLAKVKIQLGPKCTRGLGAGGVPTIGEQAAEESFRELAKELESADMVFLAAGLGGGTGTGAIPVAARVAKTIGALTIAVVTTPFSFEMGKRQRNAAIGLAKLRQNTDTLITVSNDRLLDIAPQDLPLEMAFKLADDVLRQGVSGISELLTETGLINVDFAHIKHVMHLGGGALMSIGTGEGEGKAMKALNAALHHPLLDEIDLKCASGIIANFSGGDDLTFAEVAETMAHLHSSADENTEIIPGVINNPNLTCRAQVILVVTGLGPLSIDQAIPGAEKHLAGYQAHEPISAEAFTKNGIYNESHFQFESKQMDAYSLSGAQSRINSTDLDVPSFLRKRVKG